MITLPRIPARVSLLAGVLAVLVAATVSPVVRTEVAESFTKVSVDYTELYFVRTPTVRRKAVRVPVALIRHGKGAEDYEVEVSIARPRTVVRAHLTAEPGQAVQHTFEMAPKGGLRGGFVVTVTLPGHPQSLHYRLPAATG